MNSSAEGKRSQEEEKNLGWGEKNLTEENHRGAHGEMGH
jgi:hypothetical protein